MIKFGIHLPIHGAYSYDSALEVALSADRLSFESLWVGDHFFLPSRAYRRIGGDPERPDKLDAWMVLAAIATQTKKMTLGTRVSPISFYLPSRLAKIVTTLDVISGGRAILGAGAGWHEKEAISYGVGWGGLRERTEKMREGLEVITRLWTYDRANYKGKYYEVTDAPHFPKPVQSPHPPVWLGGGSRRILKIVAEVGDGWLPTTDMALETFKEATTRIKRIAEENGRDASSIMIASALSVNLDKGAKQWIEDIQETVENGATCVLLDFSQTFVTPDKACAFLEVIKKDVVPYFQ